MAISVLLGVVAAILSFIFLVMSIDLASPAGPNFTYPGPRHSLLLFAAFPLLGLAFFFVCRPNRGEVRASDRAREGLRFPVRSHRVLWVAAAVVVVSAFSPYYAGWLKRPLGQGSSSAGHIRQQPTVHVVLTIEGMDCPICAAGLQNNLRQIRGVKRAEVRFQEKQADLEYDPTAVQATRFAQVVTEAGFKVMGAVIATD